MTINNGEIQLTVRTSDGFYVVATVYYDPVLTDGEVVTENQPLRNVNGAALRVQNDSPRSTPLILNSPDGTPRNVTVPPGETTRTRAQLAAVGISTRRDASSIGLSAP